MVSISDFTPPIKHVANHSSSWSIYPVLINAFVAHAISPSECMCVVEMEESTYVPLYSYQAHVLPTQGLPLAQGIRSILPSLPLCVLTTSAYLFPRSLSSFIDVCKKNIPLTIIVTKDSHEDDSFNPITLALSYGATFVAHTGKSDTASIVDIVSTGITHHGCSVVCIDTYDDTIYPLDEGYVPHDRDRALETARILPQRTGCFFKGEETSLSGSIHSSHEIAPLFKEFV